MNPQAPTHLLLIPKNKGNLDRLINATQSDQELLGYMMTKVPEIARDAGLENGYRVVINDGPQGCQTVYHLHLHIIGGKQLTWPPGC